MVMDEYPPHGLDFRQENLFNAGGYRISFSNRDVGGDAYRDIDDHILAEPVAVDVFDIEYLFNFFQFFMDKFTQLLTGKGVSSGQLLIPLLFQHQCEE